MRKEPAIVLTLVGVALSALVAQTPPPAPAAPTAVKVLTSSQVQQAVTIKARADELDRDYTDAIKALEAAAAKLTAIRQQQAELNKTATTVVPTYITALGGDPKADTFDWGTLALRQRPAPRPPRTP